MATKKRRSTKGRTASSGQEARRLAHRPGVWLATVSTVVGIATGMFTLRDEVFPQESGTAGAGVGSYRQHIGQICDDLNDAELARARENRRLGRRLKAADTTLAQRDALLDAVRRSTARSDHALTELGGLEPPMRYARAQRAVEALWKRNLFRILAYTERLDQAAGRRDLTAAILFLSHNRSALHRDGVEINAGLERLGEGNCRLRPAIVSRTITLPALGGAKGGGPSPNVGGGSNPNHPHTPSEPGPSVNTPNIPAPTATPTGPPIAAPGVNLPSNPGGGGAGPGGG